MRRPTYSGPGYLCSALPNSAQKKHIRCFSLTRVNSTIVLDEGLRIGGIGRRINSKVKISQTRRVSRINVLINLAYFQSVPDRPLLAPIYRWPGLKGTDRVRYILQCMYTTWTRTSTTNILGPSLTGLRGTQVTGSISYTLVTHVPLVNTLNHADQKDCLTCFFYEQSPYRVCSTTLKIWGL
jgi:hypothetical protein